MGRCTCPKKQVAEPLPVRLDDHAESVFLLKSNAINRRETRIERRVVHEQEGVAVGAREGIPQPRLTIQAIVSGVCSFQHRIQKYERSGVGFQRGLNKSG